MFDFLMDGDPIFAAAQGNSEETREGFHDFDNLLRLIGLRHPYNRIQGIVEKVGIDLGLQRFQLSFLEILLFPHLRIQQISDFARHNIEAHRDTEGIYFEVQNGAEFIPVLAGDFDTELRSISVRRPTLDDVFMKLTGREIREEEGGAALMMRQWAIHTRRGGGRLR